MRLLAAKLNVLFILAALVGLAPIRTLAVAGSCQLVFASALAVPVENPELESYESAHALVSPPKGHEPAREHGWKVLERDSFGLATRARIRVLVDNLGYDQQLFVIGPFNDWGRHLRSGDALHPSPTSPQTFVADIAGIRHGMEYRLLLNGREVLDPSAPLFTTREYFARKGSARDDINSIFWDASDPYLYQSQTDFIDLSDRPALVGEVELHSLVATYKAPWGQIGPRTTADTYRFIAESGVIDRLSEAGYTAVEMLSFNQSADGDAWSLRYQIYGLFAPDSRYGTPDELKMMIDAFHRHGLAVVMDSVVSHFPYHANTGSRRLDDIGLDQWYKADGRPLYVGPKTEWHTYRYHYANPFLRSVLIESVTTMMSEYKIDAVRMDNVDGILDEPGGADLLKDLAVAVRRVNPRSLMIAESFMHGEPEMLRRVDRGGYGFNTRTNGRLFNIWKNGLQGYTEGLDVQAIARSMRDAWNEGQVPAMSFISNHDESANPRGGFTGSYPATLIEGDPYYAFSKTKAADSLAMLMGSYHVSILQARLMQKGSFYSNSDVDWSLLNDKWGRRLWTYFGSLGSYIQSRNDFFSFRSEFRDIENHYDNFNKVLSLKRRHPRTGKLIYILVNLGHHAIDNYQFGVDRPAKFKLAFDSEDHAFGGQEELKSALHGQPLGTNGSPDHGRADSLKVPKVAPYSVSVFEEVTSR